MHDPEAINCVTSIIRVMEMIHEGERVEAEEMATAILEALSKEDLFITRGSNA